MCAMPTGIRIVMRSSSGYNFVNTPLAIWMLNIYPGIRYTNDLPFAQIPCARVYMLMPFFVNIEDQTSFVVVQYRSYKFFYCIYFLSLADHSKQILVAEL